MCEQFWTRFLAYYPCFAPRPNVQQPFHCSWVVSEEKESGYCQNCETQPGLGLRRGRLRSCVWITELLSEKVGGLWTIGKCEAWHYPRQLYAREVNNTIGECKAWEEGGLCVNLAGQDVTAWGDLLCRKPRLFANFIVSGNLAKGEEKLFKSSHVKTYFSFSFGFFFSNVKPTL